VSPVRVEICVATYRRPEALRRLLLAFDRLRFERIAAPSYRVIVVDNDAEASARRVVEETRRRVSYPIVYDVEPERGIGRAHNRCLDLSDEAADFIALMGDDAEPCEAWLEELLRMRERTGEEAVMGPVEIVYETPPSAWCLRAASLTEEKTDGSFLAGGRTGGALVDLSFVRRHDLRFDPAFGLTGGGDTEFFDRFVGRGGRIVWAKGARFREHYPAGRATRRWIFRRWFRDGNILARRIRLRGGTRLAVLRAGVAQWREGLRLLAGNGECEADERWRAVYHLIHGTGVLAGLGGYRFEEYARPFVER
jgi:hypothetical protein